MVRPIEYMSIIFKLFSFFMESESSAKFFLIFLLGSPIFYFEVSLSAPKALNRLLELSV